MLHRYLLLSLSCISYWAHSSEAKRSRNNQEIIRLANGIPIPKSDFTRLTSLLDNVKIKKPATYKEYVRASKVVREKFLPDILKHDQDLAIFKKKFSNSPVEGCDGDSPNGLYLGLIILNQETTQLSQPGQKVRKNKPTPRSTPYTSLRSQKTAD